MENLNERYLKKLVAFEGDCQRFLSSPRQKDCFTGEALFYYLLWRVTGESTYLSESVTRAARSIETASDMWFITFLHKRGVMSLDVVELLDSVDGKIYIQSLKDIIRQRYSVVDGGAVGVCYALNRVPDVKALGYLKQVVDIVAVSKVIQLCEACQESDTFPDDISSLQVNDVVAVGNILTRIHQSGLFGDKIQPMLEACANFLYQALTLEPVTCGENTLWDSGVIGQLLSVLTLSQVLNSKQLGEEGIKIMNDLEWPTVEKLSDLTLRSGAAGLVHVLKRLQRTTNSLNCSQQCALYTRKIEADHSIFRSLNTSEFFSGQFGIHVAMLDTFVDDDRWAEILYPIA